MKDSSTVLRKLQDKKNRSLALALSYARIGEWDEAHADRWNDKARLVLDCGTYIGLVDTDEGAKIVEANFCKDRLCPACNWRRSLKIYGATSEILDYLDQTRGNDIKYLFLTLTVKNVPLPMLGQTVDGMAAAFKRLIDNKAWKRRVLGCMRTLEVTINHETMEAHPHYHLILAVPESYADKRKGDKLYWDVDDWNSAWKKAARLDYIPNVKIERVRGRRSGIAEVSKYMSKDTDYLVDCTKLHIGTEEAEAMTDYIVRNLAAQMKGRRLVSYTGILHDAQRALRLDPEEGPLTDTIRGDIAGAIKRYHWSAGLTCYQQGRGN